MLLEAKRIFFVEDNLENRIITTMLLEQHGAQTAFERWGTHTLQRLIAFEPVDLILLDLMLPQGVTGYQVFDMIRQHPNFDDVPVVAVSAKDPAIAIPETRARGFSGFIAKPVDFDLFPQQLARVLNKEHIWYTGQGYVQQENQV